MLVQFQSQYYNYKGVVNNGEEETNEDNNGLAIGTFQSAFCADISTTYTYRMCTNTLDQLKYTSFYRNDGLAIFDGKRTRHETILWLRKFQLCINDIVGGNFLQCNAELWVPPDDNGNPSLIEEDDEMNKVDMPAEEWEKWEEK
eukprot:6736322-Ditylum_brightwellii.AAC.1